MKYLYLIVGPSGSGKTTLEYNLSRRFDGLRRMESYTTRPERYKDEPGHIFVTDKIFDSLGPMVAYTEINGYKYGVIASQIESADTYVIDTDGVRYLKEHYTGDRKFKVIWLYASEVFAKSRMFLRGDSDYAVSSRIEHDKEAFSDVSIADKVFYTDYKSALEVAREVTNWIKKQEEM